MTCVRPCRSCEALAAVSNKLDEGSIVLQKDEDSFGICTAVLRPDEFQRAKLLASEFCFCHFVLEILIVLW